MNAAEGAPYYAISPHRSGVFFFPTAEERDRWIADLDGAAVDPRRVDPDIRAEAEQRLGAP